MMPDGKIAIGILETFESQVAVDDQRYDWDESTTSWVRASA
jgi:hypothetical protein